MRPARWELPNTYRSYRGRPLEPVGTAGRAARRPHRSRWSVGASSPRIPGARLWVIPGAGHLVPEDQPAELTAALFEFLHDLPGSASANDHSQTRLSAAAGANSRTSERSSTLDPSEVRFGAVGEVQRVGPQPFSYGRGSISSGRPTAMSYGPVVPGPTSVRCRRSRRAGMEGVSRGRIAR
jgi:hypothetical protein